MATVSIPASTALAVHLLCALGLAAGYWLARHFYSSTLVADPVRVLRLLLVVESLVVIVAYSLVRSDRGRTSFLKAVGRGLLGLPIGALINAFGAIVLGAPIWIDLYQQFVFMALQGMIGSVYWIFPRLPVLLITWLACQDMEL